MDMTRFKCGGVGWGWMRDFLSGVLVSFFNVISFRFSFLFLLFFWWGWGRERTWEWEWESFVEIDWDWEREERARKGEMIWEREGENGMSLSHTYKYIREQFFLRWGGLRWVRKNALRYSKKSFLSFFVAIQPSSIQFSLLVVLPRINLTLFF